MLEQSRREDPDSPEKRIQKIREDRKKQHKELKALRAQQRKIEKDRQKVIRKCTKASTADLLEVLRYRTMRQQAASRRNPTPSTATPPPGTTGAEAAA